MRKIRANRRFTPTAEHLEQIALLTTYTNVAGIGGWYQDAILVNPLVDSVNAWGFPGQAARTKFFLPVANPGFTLPHSYTGLKSVSMSYSIGGVPVALPNPQGGVTSYSLGTGQYSLTTGISSLVQAAPGAASLEMPYIAPKDAATITITVDATYWYVATFMPKTYATDDYVVTMTMQVEAPTITTYSIQSGTNFANPAPPLWYGVNDTTNPNAAGSYIGFIPSSNGTTREFVGYRMTVTNNTHYDLNLGFLQDVYATNVNLVYAGGQGPHGSASNLLDVATGQSTFFLGDAKTLVPAGGTVSYPTTPSIASDSPSLTPAKTDPSLGNLTSILWTNSFDAHLAVIAGKQPSGPNVPGIPIALSTIKWHAAGTATIGGAHQETMAPGYFTTFGGVGMTNTPWTAIGDGVRKYLAWSGTTQSFAADLPLAYGTIIRYGSEARPTAAAVLPCNSTATRQVADPVFVLGPIDAAAGPLDAAAGPPDAGRPMRGLRPKWGAIQVDPN